MKKFALLMLLVLGTSSVALGVCNVDVCVDSPSEGQALMATLGICCSGQWTVDPCIETTVFCSTIYIDVTLNCTSQCGCTCTELPPVQLLKEADCGLYLVMVRVWMDYSGCGWPYCMFSRPMLVGMGSESVFVKCDDCGCYPCSCSPCWPYPVLVRR